MVHLTGIWEGEFRSVETGRNGTITFNLAANADTASGGVTMLTRPSDVRRLATGDPSGVQQQPLARTLFITFVQAENDLVSGKLDPYQDPDCDCILNTVFEGRLEGNRIEGTYTSRSQATGLFVKGTWYVERRKL